HPVHIDSEKRLIVHLVWAVCVREEFKDNPVSKNSDTRLCDRKIAEELRGMVDGQLGACRLALNEDRNFAIIADGIINLFPFLCSNVARELRDDLCRVEYVVTKRLKEWHDQSVLCGLFSQ